MTSNLRLLALILLVTLVFACEHSSVKKAPDSTEEEPQGLCGTTGISERPPRIYQAHCETCHMFSKNATGPAMQGILDRVPSEEWLRSFITNQDSMVRIKDPYTLDILQYSPVDGHHNHKFSPEELDTLIEYITQ